MPRLQQRTFLPGLFKLMTLINGSKYESVLPVEDGDIRIVFLPEKI
jgi:hypothetical protein